MDVRSPALMVLSFASLLVIPTEPSEQNLAPPASPREAVVSSADIFQYPLSSWSPHCLGFGSQWRYCNGTALRACASGAVWLHTGADEVASVGQPVMAAGDGMIIGYLTDPEFRGAMLIRHQTSAGVVITQYWHVWPRAGFGVGALVKRGQVFADVADMGARTHFHFAVFNGDMESHAWNGALPPGACAGFPAFPYRFIDPNAFVESHLPPVHFARGIRLLIRCECRRSHV